MFGRREPEPAGGGLVHGLLLGVVIGAGLALVLTPYTGRAMRAQLLHLVDRARHEVRGTERYGGGPDADPVLRLKQRWEDARQEARRAYDIRRAELLTELERDRHVALRLHERGAAEPV